MKKEHVIILHGIARTSLHMKPVATFLEKNGYVVHNLDYPSNKLPLADLSSHALKNIKQAIGETGEKVHFIGYSMGGLLLRIILKDFRPVNMGRILHLATPNCGSHVADYFVKSRAFGGIYRKIFGPAGQQLVTNQKDIDGLFGPVNYELGIIAGDGCVDPFCYFLLPKPHDGKVSVECTKLDGMKDHVVVRGSHLFFPSNKRVHKNVLQFLRKGHFTAGQEQPENH